MVTIGGRGSRLTAEVTELLLEAEARLVLWSRSVREE